MAAPTYADSRAALDTITASVLEAKKSIKAAPMAAAATIKNGKNKIDALRSDLKLQLDAITKGLADNPGSAAFATLADEATLLFTDIDVVSQDCDTTAKDLDAIANR